MNKVYLLFAIHSHQPVGNFERVFAQAVRDCYAPFVEMLQDHPRVRLSLHFSGPLLEWFEEREPRLLDTLRRLSERGQVEMMGGGFYEPLLSYIPQRDAHGQLQMMADYCRRRFGQRPQGFWLTERVWDPAMPLRLAGSGLRYTVVDDTHLLYAGLTEADVRGYYLTERDGLTLAVFPTHKQLRYLIPFRQVEETLEWLRHKAEESPGIALTYGDDGEKFGVWPGTRQWVFEEGWLKRFFSAVEDASDWLEMLPLGDYLERFPPTGRIYLPTASYEEMTEWALPVEAQLRYQDLLAELERLGKREEWRPFIRAGIWDNFLVKYAESNLMHKRMLWASHRVHSLGERPEAMRELYRSQCNCAYWHGLFGGLYLKHLRGAVFHHLILAERLAEEAKPTGWAELERCDYDRDGREELVVTNGDLFACLSPGAGGSLLELDFKGSAANLTDTLTRRQEAYHRALKQAGQQETASPEGEPLSIHERVAVKEKGLEKLLVYDTYERRSFLDHFLTEAADIEMLRGGGEFEEGDFVGAPYRLATCDLRPEAAGSVAYVRLTREGRLLREGRPHPLKLTKTYRVTPAPGAGLAVDYELAAKSTPAAGALPCRFGVELNLSAVGENDSQVHVEVAGKRHPAGDKLETGPVDGLVLVDERQGYRLEISAEPAAILWLWPLETVSQSDEGFERNRQGTVLLLSWPVSLAAGQPQRFRISLTPGPAA